jgi:hypothetical protein
MVERQIQEAMDRGEFDNLPGAGEPIEGIDRPYDPSWWAKEWVRRNRLMDEARDLRQSALDRDRRLRAVGDFDTADRCLAEASRALGRINRMLPATDRIPTLRDSSTL